MKSSVFFRSFFVFLCLITYTAKSQHSYVSDYTKNSFLLDSLTAVDSINNIKEIIVLRNKLTDTYAKYSNKILSDSINNRYLRIKALVDKALVDKAELSQYLLDALHELANKIKNDTLNLKIQFFVFHLSTELKMGKIQYNSFFNTLKYGNDSLDILFLFLADCNSISKDSIEHIFNNLNQNYALNKHYNNNFNLDIYFRTIYFYDQVPRILSRKKNKVLYFNENETDLYVQSVFKFIVSNYKIFDTKYQAIYDKEIQLLLIHASVTNPSFVEFYFKDYFKTFGYDFNIIDSPKFIMDNYLKFRYNKQYFGMAKGMDKNGKINLLPKISEKEFQEILLNNFKLDKSIN